MINPETESEVFNAVKQFLSPSIRPWYNEHGFPHRLGYLFYGPPGTGKSSTAFVLASYFCLPIYILSLNGLTMDENACVKLFKELPDRCILLREDIDTAELGTFTP